MTVSESRIHSWISARRAVASARETLPARAGSARGLERRWRRQSPAPPAAGTARVRMHMPPLDDRGRGEALHVHSPRLPPPRFRSREHRVSGAAVVSAPSARWVCSTPRVKVRGGVGGMLPTRTAPAEKLTARVSGSR